MSNKPYSCPVNIPENFDADTIIEKVLGKKVRVDKKNNMIASMYFILNSLIERMSTRDGRDELAKKGGISLNSDILGGICGKRYTEALKILEDEKIISRDQSYSTGKYSKVVTLIGASASCNLKVREIPTSSIRDKVLEYRKGKDNQNISKLSKIPHITQWFNEKLTFDYIAFHNYIEHYRSKLLKLHKVRSNHKKSDEDVKRGVSERYNNILQSAEKIIRGDFNLSRGGKDNRLHSTISNMKKEARPFLKYNEQPLVGVDIMSSQPFLFTQLLRLGFYKEEKEKINILSLYPSLSKLINTKEIESILMSVTSPNSFNEIDWDKDFYNILIQLDEKEFNAEKRIFVDRQRVKQDIMLILFDKKHSGKGEAFQRFKHFFPIEAKLIQHFHSLGAKVDHHLPILLQRLESRIMLDIVCREVSTKLPEAPIIPVHDCILTTPVYQEQVKEIMSRVIEMTTGIKAGLKLENDSSGDIIDDIENTVQEELKEIYRKKHKQRLIVTPKKPLLFEIPKLGGKQILSTRYIDDNLEMTGETPEDYKDLLGGFSDAKNT